MASELQHDAVATFILSTLRSEGMSDSQILDWCRPNVTDQSFEEAMQQNHGIQVSAAGVKYRVESMIQAGTTVN